MKHTLQALAKLPQLKLNTDDASKVGLIEIDDKAYTQQQLEG